MQTRWIDSCGRHRAKLYVLFTLTCKVQASASRLQPKPCHCWASAHCHPELGKQMPSSVIRIENTFWVGCSGSPWRGFSRKIQKHYFSENRMKILLAILTVFCPLSFCIRNVSSTAPGPSRYFLRFWVCLFCFEKT